MYGWCRWRRWREGTWRREGLWWRELWRAGGEIIVALAQAHPDQPARDGSARQPEDSFG
jgi:hypothetical protein